MRAKSVADARHYAMKLWEIGTEQLQDGHVQLALDTFSESIDAYPTAEGYTYRAWALSYQDRFGDAVSDCMRAVKLDPDFGNPYNDLGVYLMHLGRLDEAVTWLERAKRAARYVPRHFPFLNLGHIHMMRDEQHLALFEYVRALELDPGNEAAQEAIAAMDMNF